MRESIKRALEIPVFQTFYMLNGILFILWFHYLEENVIISKIYPSSIFEPLLQ